MAGWLLISVKHSIFISFYSFPLKEDTNCWIMCLLLRNNEENEKDEEEEEKKIREWGERSFTIIHTSQ